VSSALLSEATDQSPRKQDLARSVRLGIPRTARAWRRCRSGLGGRTAKRRRKCLGFGPDI